jgi:hypothetical protein
MGAGGAYAGTPMETPTKVRADAVGAYVAPTLAAPNTSATASLRINMTTLQCNLCIKLRMQLSTGKTHRCIWS